MRTMIEYRDDVMAIRADQLAGGFFEGWPSPPSPEQHLAHLRGAEVAIVAVDVATGRIVGFVSAIGDGVFAAFVPLLEVLPAYRGRGIGTELVRRVLLRLGDRYSIDLVCDADLVPFYERLGGTPGQRDPVAAARHGGRVARPPQHAAGTIHRTKAEADASDEHY
jgi:GNAT superfamily N-acetyltransferase